MEGGATGSPQEAGAGWDGRPEPRQGLKGAYLRLHLTHTFHRKSTRKGTFDLGGRSGRRRRCRRRPSLPCILQESRGHRRPLRRRVRSRPRWEQPGLGTRPPPAAGPRQPPCPRGGFSAATEGGGALRVSVRSESRRHGQQAGAGLEAGRGAVSLWRSVPVSHGVRATPGKLPASVYLPVKWAFWEDIWGCCGD